VECKKTIIGAGVKRQLHVVLCSQHQVQQRIR
jgi:hypothetical protein